MYPFMSPVIAAILVTAGAQQCVVGEDGPVVRHNIKQVHPHHLHRPDHTTELRKIPQKSESNHDKRKKCTGTYKIC